MNAVKNLLSYQFKMFLNINENYKMKSNILNKGILISMNYQEMENVLC